MDAREDLRGIARRHGAPVRPCNLGIAGVGTLDARARFQSGGRRIQVATDGTWLVMHVAVATTFCFAAGMPDPIMGCRTLLTAVLDIPVFVGDREGDHNLVLRRWLGESQCRQALIDLDLRSPELIWVANNRVMLAVSPRGVDVDLARLQTLLALTELLPLDDQADRDELAALDLPAGLDGLAPLMVMWVTGDDDERSERIAAAPDRQLDALWQAVSPHLAEIDSLFDRAGPAPPERVAAVGRLAEAALEAHLELKRRRG
jgi:hypothetical protein